MKSKNYVLEPTHHDLAELQGDIAYVFGENTRRAGVFDPDYSAEVVRRLEDAGFDPAHDRIVVAGRIVPYSVAIAAIVSRWGPVWALLFDSRERRYMVLRIGETTRDERRSKTSVLRGDGHSQEPLRDGPATRRVG